MLDKRLVKYGLLTFILICCINTFSYSQTETDEQLAAQYFQNKEYDKAVVLYEKLYTKKPDYVYYNPYLECLIQLKEYKKAEKMIKKQVKSNPLTPQYSVDLGYLYLSQGDEQQAIKQDEAIIKELLQDKQYIIDVANAFINRNQPAYAIQTYAKGRKVMNGSYPFNLELASIYEEQGEYDKMMEEYISLLEYSTSYAEEVQGILQDLITEETDNKKSTALKNVLLQRIKKNPDETFYAEMLLWYSTQIKEFETAFIQAKAIDKRKKEDGKRVFNVARLAASNGAYDVAIAAYQYIIDKGADSYYYINSKIEQLDIKYQKIINSPSNTKTELLALETSIKSTLDELGKSSSSLYLIQNLAHLQAFYLDKSAEAITLLQEVLKMPNAQASSLAACKIELADIMLMTGEIWEATLLYSQVEKAFKDEPIGHQAKFKNAMFSYYIGEFEWAKAQLDVLKAATSKLIANDALSLSLLISDNMDPDSSYGALSLYARADMLSFRNKDDQALQTLDSIFTKYTYHAIFDEALYKKATIYLKKGLTDSAAACYQKIITAYSFDILGDDATYKLAVLYEDVYKDKTKAMELYEKLMTDYPGSTYVVDGRKRYRALRGDVLK